MVNIANMARTYSEVYAFLEVIGQAYIEKIPAQIYDTIKEKRDLNYKPDYNKNGIMTEDMISKEALALIAGLYLEYWCENESEKRELKQAYINNSEKEQEKFSYENLFKRESVEEKQTNEETALVEYQEKNIFGKLLNKIRTYLKLRKK